LVRVETERGELPPLDPVPWQEHPRVARGYDLLRPGPAKAFVEYKEFARDVAVGPISPDGSYFVMRAMPDPTDPQRRIIKVMDGATGLKEIQSLPERVAKPEAHSLSTMGPTGGLLVLQVAHDGQLSNLLFQMPAGTVLKSFATLGWPSAGAKLWSV